MAIVLVTAGEVFRWSMEGQSEPIKIFDRHATLNDTQIVDFKTSPDEKWMVLIGIKSEPGTQRIIGADIGNTDPPAKSLFRRQLCLAARYVDNQAVKRALNIGSTCIVICIRRGKGTVLQMCQRGVFPGFQAPVGQTMGRKLRLRLRTRLLRLDEYFGRADAALWPSVPFASGEDGLGSWEILGMVTLCLGRVWIMNQQSNLVGALDANASLLSLAAHARFEAMRELEEMRPRIPDLSALELGAGLGLASIAAARSGCRSRSGCGGRLVAARDCDRVHVCC